jgi:DNA-binding CsgD family transcriptional regulator
MLSRSTPPLPPLPDPRAAAESWAIGRTLPQEVAIAEALAVDLDAPAAAPAIPAPNVSAHTFGLSPREQEVLGLLCERLSDREIAERLFVSPRTVSSHVAHLFTKLDVSSRREAAALAARHGLI